MNGLALCAGIDGLGLGIKLAEPEYRTVVHVERESWAVARLVEWMEAAAMEPAPIWDAVESFDGRPWRGVVDVVTAGFPCPPWSAAGKRQGLDDERWLWPHIARIIAECEPQYVFLENVPGLVRGGGLAFVAADLAYLGYDAEWDCFSAAGVGAPHRRRRLFVVAQRVPDRDCDCLRNGAERGEGRAQATDQRDAGTAHVGSGVAHGHGHGHGREGERSGSVHNGVGSALGNDVDRRDLPFWPPGPDDVHAWRQVPADLEPSVCGVAHGVAAGCYRRAALHALGNSVVPLAAAHAWRTLKARLAPI